MDRLKADHYNADALQIKLKAFVPAVLEQDGNVTSQARQFFEGLKTALLDDGVAQQPASVMFNHCLMLAWLTLHALFGLHMNDPGLASLRLISSASPETMLARYFRTPLPAQLLTNRQCSLCGTPLRAERFVGREALLEQLVERLQKGGKTMVNGIGGIGKTELVLQAVVRLEQLRVFDRLAYVQYDVSLASSFAAAFTGLKANNQEAGLQECRRLLERQHAGRTLLLIDNLNQPASEDAALTELNSYGCDIVVTSRLSGLEGFDVLTVPELELEPGIQLFADSYQYHLENQQAELEQLWRQVKGHPLTLSLLGSLCRSKYWSIGELLHRMDEAGLRSLSFVRNAATLSFAQVLGEVFSCAGLDNSEQRLLCLIAMLPYVFWRPDTLLPLARDITLDGDTLCDMLQRAADHGWLTQSEPGYLMHPVIAEAVRPKHCACSDYPRLWQFWNEQIAEDPYTSAYDHGEIANTAEMLRHTSELNADGLRVLVKTLDSIAATPYSTLQPFLMQLYRRQLDSQPYSPCNEANYLVKCCYWDAVKGHPENMAGYMEKLGALPIEALTAGENHRALCNILEAAATLTPRSLIESLYARIRPAEHDSRQMIVYLTSLSWTQWSVYREPLNALASTEETLAILNKLQLQDTLYAADCAYRHAIALSEVGRQAEGIPYIKRCLDLMQKYGYQEDSPTVIRTKCVYALFLGNDGQYEASLKIYQEVEDVYRQQQREDAFQYAVLLCGKATVSAAGGQLEEAAAIARRFLAIDDARTTDNYQLRGVHYLRAAQILGKAGYYEEAWASLEKSYALRREHYGDDSLPVADCDTVRAEILAAMGRREEALAVLLPAWKKIKTSSDSSFVREKEVLKLFDLLQGDAEQE